MDTTTNDRVRKVLTAQFSAAPPTDADVSIEYLGGDTLDAAAIVMALEVEFNVTIADSWEVTPASRVSELVAVVNACLPREVMHHAV